MKFLRSHEFIAVVVLTVVIGITYLFYGRETKEIRYIRKNANSIEAKKDLEALDKALKIMRAKDCKDPLSWYYQGAIHWIPDTIKNNKLCESYATYLDKKIAWDNCTHTPSGKEKIHFLVWHRLYIYHFEKIVRKLSGYKEFALPYWAYTDNGSKNKYMPIIMINKNSSLYENCRFDSLNMGYPISGEIERALDLTKLMENTDYKTFCYNINAAPHGAIHDYVGHGNEPTGKQFNNPITGTVTEDGLMGWVPTAGFDPIFWLHHSNIDRIWQQWTNSKNGKMISLEELKSVPWDYVFFDENGKKVVYTMEDVIKILYTMDYDFDDTKLSYKVYTEPLTNIAYENKIGNNTKKTVVDKTLTNISPLDLSNIFKSSVIKMDVVKVIVKVSFTKRPKGVYELYVDLPNNLTPSVKSKNFVGYMTFFGADHTMPKKECLNGCCESDKTNDGRTSVTFEYIIKPQIHYNFSVYKHNGQHYGDLIVEEVSVIKGH